MNKKHLEESFEDAQITCSQDGGRLWEPKNVEGLETLLNLNTIFKQPIFPGTNADHYFAIGVKLSLVGGEITPVYWNNIPMPENIREHVMIWEGGEPPTVSDAGKCVAILNGTMRPVECNNFYSRKLFSELD